VALLLADAQRLTNNQFVQGIIETIILESDILAMLPFMEVNGASLLYNQEATLSGASWYAPSATWTEQAVTVTQKTAALTILGGDVDVDNFMNQTFRNPNQLRAEAVQSKAKAVAFEFNDKFFNGLGSSNQPTGLRLLASAGQTYSLGVNGATPTLADYDTMIDLIKPGKPDCIVMSKRSRRTLKALRRASGGGFLETDYNAFGKRVEFYDGIPIIVDDNISDALTVGTSVNCSTVFAIKFGYATGVMGLMNGMIQTNEIGYLETKDAFRTRLKWYVSLANFRDLSLAIMTGVRP
jgi:HK97 family phage major capsid protein